MQVNEKSDLLVNRKVVLNLFSYLNLTFRLPMRGTEIVQRGIISLLHCFAMKMYSKRRKRKLEIVQEELKNEISL